MISMNLRTCLCSAFVVLFSASCFVSAAATRIDPYQKWLDEDVRWIITSSERAQFLKLSTDEQKDQFIVAFWDRRNPPGAPADTFKHEYYRRIAFSNLHFAAGSPGWETARGRVYIVYGPPDSIDNTSMEEDGPAKPMQVWRYQHMPGRTDAAVIRFVDRCECGNYVRELVPSDKNPLP